MYLHFFTLIESIHFKRKFWILDNLKSISKFDKLYLYHQAYPKFLNDYNYIFEWVVWIFAGSPYELGPN